MADIYPLAERDYYDSLLGAGPGDPDMYPRIVYIGEDKAVVEHKVDTTHWSELPKPGEFGDNDKPDPEQNWED